MAIVWRLLDTGCADGATNMAIDEAMLEAFIAGDGVPTLRFYGWAPPCVSVGYFQSVVNEIDIERCRELGIEWVRRITGGRLILHQHELTYSVVASKDDALVSGRILESYRKISLGLYAGLSELGIIAQLADPNDPSVAAVPGIKRGVCFDAAAGHELVVDGRKIFGSAQVRHRGAVLQHGSLLIDVDPALHYQILYSVQNVSEDEFTAAFRSRVLTLSQILGRKVTRAEVVRAITHGFERVWNVGFERIGLNAVEQDLVTKLSYKYRDNAWNFSR